MLRSADAMPTMHNTIKFAPDVNSIYQVHLAQSTAGIGHICIWSVQLDVTNNRQSQQLQLYQQQLNVFGSVHTSALCPTH